LPGVDELGEPFEVGVLLAAPFTVSRWRTHDDNASARS
jgi:hypothetical protein